MSSKLSHRVSFILNVVLAGIVAALILHRSEPMSGPPATAADVVKATAPTAEPKSANYPQTASASAQRRWLVDQLRAMGVPNKVLARIVLADLDWSWNKLGGELSLRSHGDPDTLAAFKLDNAMSLDAHMRAALGEEGFKQWDHENMLREANRGKLPLTPAEVDGTYGLWKALQKRELELKKARLTGEMDEMELNAAFEKSILDFEQQMETLLGEERYAKARQIDEGANLRQGLAKADVNDSQFRELLETQKQWNELRFEIDQQFQNEPSSSAYLEQLSVLDEARDQEYRRVLGTEVFDAFQKEQHPSYSLMTKYANLWGLDNNKIDSVYGSIRYYEKTVQDYQAQVRAIEAQGQAVDWEGVNKNLSQFADQAQQALQNYLGQDSFNKMQRNGVFRFDQNPSHEAPLKPEDRAGGG